MLHSLLSILMSIYDLNESNLELLHFYTCFCDESLTSVWQFQIKKTAPTIDARNERAPREDSWKDRLWQWENIHTSQKMKFFIKNLFSKFDQIRKKQQILSHLLNKPLMENFIFLCSDKSGLSILLTYVMLWIYLAEVYLEPTRTSTMELF